MATISWEKHMLQRPSQLRYHWRYFLRCCTGVVGVTLTCTALLINASETSQRSVQGSMQQIFQALTTVFPLALHHDTYAAPEHHQTIRTALAALATHAAQLEQHGRDSVPGFGFLRRSLVNDAQDALRRFDQGQYQASQFVLQQLTENCFACHSKLPPARRSLLGEQFIASPEVASLGLKERARLAVGTRQFDTALALYERLFQAADISASEIDLMGAFEEYLKVAIRVHDDVMRPIITLQQFLQRADIPAFLRQHLLDWLDAFRSLESVQPNGASLARARSLIQTGQGRNRFPADRRGLVHFVVASGLLQRYLETSLVEPVQIAEAHYLLGITESYISRTLWRPETEFLLETAIRTAPTSAPARAAYAFLENYLITRYTGSAGLHLPPEVRQHLHELRQVLEGR
jgi:hypothetical protein